jgi:hypothetical protein
MLCDELTTMRELIIARAGIPQFFLEIGVLRASASIDAHSHFIKTKYSV